MAEFVAPTQPIRRVGYIGLGIMGAAMARNLLRAGFDVMVWNRSSAKSAGFPSIAGSPADLAAAGPQVLCINVTDTAAVERVLLGPRGVMESASAGLIVVDHSTISPAGTRRLAQQLEQRGVTLLDAPVSGGDVGARNATLSIMVGGPQRAFEYVKPVLHAVGRAVTHLGAAGSGQVCKAANQISVSLNLLGVCEAMAFAKRSGLDPSKMIEVVAGGAGASWQLTQLGPRIARRDFQPGFMLDLLLKDLDMVLQAAGELGLPLAGLETARARFAQARQIEGGRAGTQALAAALEQAGRFRFHAEAEV